jgi:NAD(P)-dependent dehydrogenase (short-subunit alcohol dehydrogenase family)
VKQFGRIDFLVNNAAVRYETAFADMSYDEWRSVLSIVLDGAFLCAQACMPHLVKAAGGTIVNIGGQTGHKGAAERAHVITAKAGLAGMTKALAMDLAPHKITVNCVVPGTIDRQRGLPGVPDRPAHRMTVPPIGRRGEPEEIAAMVRMLCGPTRATSLASRSTSTAAGSCREHFPSHETPERLHRAAGKKRLPPAVAERTKHPRAGHHRSDGVRLAPPSGRKGISYVKG